MRALLSSSAPRHLAVLGLPPPGGAGGAPPTAPQLLGSFEYDAAGPAVQTFVLPHTAAAFPAVQLQVRSNWGSAKFTCLYRVRVHGAPLHAVTAATRFTVTPEDERGGEEAGGPLPGG